METLEEESSAGSPPRDDEDDIIRSFILVPLDELAGLLFSANGDSKRTTVTNLGRHGLSVYMELQRKNIHLH
jgi:hypothetical protein